MASNVRQNRTLEAYCCLRGLENEVTSDFCLAPFYYFKDSEVMNEFSR